MRVRRHRRGEARDIHPEVREDLGPQRDCITGLRELQLWDVGSAGLDATFADVEELAADCRFGDCTHVHEPDCAVLAAVESLAELEEDQCTSAF